jgi:hypothetical protein
MFVEHVLVQAVQLPKASHVHVSCADQTNPVPLGHLQLEIIRVWSDPGGVQGVKTDEEIRSQADPLHTCSSLVDIPPHAGSAHRRVPASPALHTISQPTLIPPSTSSLVTGDAIPTPTFPSTANPFAGAATLTKLVPMLVLPLTPNLLGGAVSPTPTVPSTIKPFAGAALFAKLVPMLVLPLTASLLTGAFSPIPADPSTIKPFAGAATFAKLVPMLAFPLTPSALGGAVVVPTPTLPDCWAKRVSPMDWSSSYTPRGEG